VRGAERLRQVLRENGVQGALRRWSARELRRAAGRLQRMAAGLLSPRRPEHGGSAETLALLAPNRELRDVGRGRRCFVLASGPSTLEQDLTRLRGEPVIAVNEMFLRLQRDRVDAAVLIFQDSVYLGTTQGYGRFVQDFTAAAAAMGASAFVPLAARCIVDDRAVRPRHHYVAFVGELLDHPEDVPPALDFAAPLPVLYTVAHTAIALALFMGYSEILTLGIDLDYVAAPGEPIRHGYGANPYNDHDVFSAADVYRRDQGWGMPDVLENVARQVRAFERLRLENVARQVRAFERLRAMAEARGSKIYNLSPVGFLDVFERRVYASAVADGTAAEARAVTTRS
jgi:hypothetical protein